MKMLKKLLAVVLTGAMALTLLTACGGNAVRDKDIADALNDIVKSSVAVGKHENYTFKPGTDEQAMAKAIAALPEKDWNITAGGGSNKFSGPVMKILGLDESSPNKTSRFVWCGAVVADEIGATGQAYHAMNEILGKDAANADKLTNKKPADIRHIGTALSTTTYFGGKQKTVRIIVVTAEAEPVDKK